jgi:kynurenine formamidase
MTISIGTARGPAARASAAALGIAILLCATATAAPAQDVTRETLDRWMVELSNTGRWGPDDERGTLNLITPAATVRAASLVRSGISVSLSHDYITEPAPDVPSPWEHEMLGGQGAFASDRFGVAYHGFIHSHMDALCHNSHEGVTYNDFPRAEVVREDGCARLGITNAKQGIVTRGVLMDIARLRGEDYLAPGTAIRVEDLEAWEARTGITVREGDVVLVRAGRWARREAEGPCSGMSAPGLHASVVPWLHERGVAMIGSDYANDVIPSGVEGSFLPVHQLTLVAMGMPLFDNLDLEAVARVAAEQGRWEFLFAAAPLAVPGATGSPLNPLAIF